MTTADAIGATVGVVLVTAGMGITIGIGPAVIALGVLVIVLALLPKRRASS